VPIDKIMPLRRLLLPLLAAVATLLCVAGAASAKPALGIADNKPDTFTDARLNALGLKLARINIPWDVLDDPNTLPRVDAWMAAAKSAGMKPFVSFDRSRREGMNRVNPTPQQLADAFTKWRWRWGVVEVSAWNEPNINGKSPARVAQWWLALRKACPGCIVLPGELVDRKNAVKWAKDFVKAAKRAPSIWPLHAYVDANNFSVTATKAFLKAVKGKVWLTETGGVVAPRKPTSKVAGAGEDFQTQVTSYLLNTLVKSSPRIQRLYLYSWSSGSGPLTWDSGLVGPDDRARPALNVVRKYLGLPPVEVAPPGDTFKRKVVKKPTPRKKRR
jgi:hypothetical protein